MSEEESQKGKEHMKEYRKESIQQKWNKICKKLYKK